MNAYLTRKKWPLSLLAGISLLGLTAAQRHPPDENILQRIARQVSEYYAAILPEKAYLHLDKPVYATGETIWFSAYVVDALRHQADSTSKVLYVDLVSAQQKVVARRTLRLRGGYAYGDIDVADTLAAGTYLLRAYTSWMRNAGDGFVYSRRLQVWAASPFTAEALPSLNGTRPAVLAAGAVAGGKPDVQFFPEGGNLLEGLPAVVAYKATAATGKGIEVRGQILDDHGTVVVANFATVHLGMGHFAFTPAAGQHYHAHLTLPGGGTADYPLPAPQASGYTLHVTNANDQYLVEARYRPVPGAPAPGPVMLLTEVRGFLVYMTPRPLGTPDAPLASWRVSKARYPNGILHLTLMDEQGTPQAERLAFVQNGPANLTAALTPDKASYGLRAPVQLRLHVADAAGQPTAARVSVAVAEASLSALDPNAETIASNLLLTSDLAGYVENPGYYFQNQTAATAQALDDLLLTQGWRRFVWKDVLAGKPAAVPFAADKALALAGQVVSEHGYRPIPNSQLTFIESRPVRQVATGATDAYGRFRFVGFDGRDTAVVTLQARRAQGGSNVVIRPDAGPPLDGLRLPALPAPPPAVTDYVKRSRQQQADEHEMNPEMHSETVMRSVLLGNVAVTAKRVAVPADDPRRLYPGVVGGTVVDFADLPAAQSGMNILQVLQGRVAGLTISGSPPNMQVQIRNQGSPQFILDGQRVDLDFITSLTSNDIESVEVFKGTEAAIFGGTGGVIAIYTKRADRNYKGPTTGPAPGIAVVRLPGYYQTREFYTPRYGAPTLTAPGPDPRRTSLYWNPTVQTDAHGEATLTFFTADGGGTYQAVVEGLTPSGQPVRGTATVVVQGQKH